MYVPAVSLTIQSIYPVSSVDHSAERNNRVRLDVIHKKRRTGSVDVLQWSGIQRWIQVVLAELNNPATTNEEMKTTAPKLVGVVATLFEAKVKEGRVEELRGKAAVWGFFEPVKVRKNIKRLRGAVLTILGIGRVMQEGWETEAPTTQVAVPAPPGYIKSDEFGNFPYFETTLHYSVLCFRRWSTGRDRLVLTTKKTLRAP
ncbi:hypothetical protein C8A01DRAFT_21551 [Parachaetomium inaequale]|uniref:Uncharacterized protein n=1 Tax=Parachaetomium inaequale TaxID=2588326 RepID=A0AAN6SL78_9PEZI|nr:hypothetical protein C8A01DRAFT_21551 [Parachaetomium inaequale]